MKLKRQTCVLKLFLEWYAYCYVFTTQSLLSDIKFKTASLNGLENVLEDRHILVESGMLDRPANLNVP